MKTGVRSREGDNLVAVNMLWSDDLIPLDGRINRDNIY
jgi:hypothetical protein